ncbi:hypothetical protein OG933_00325 [Streptomyces sp. NBC_00016]|uniref:hypothetical protein n=1 Tax=Streptomyces sp. NBC_00016 TaxID=2975622 RepID=UPI00324CE8EF
MPDEAADPAEPADPAARFERSRKEFAEDLTVLLIKCGNPTQKSLVDAAAKHAAKKQNDKFRLNPSTLSAVLHGHVFPGNEFLSALIMQRPSPSRSRRLQKIMEGMGGKMAETRIPEKAGRCVPQKAKAGS